MCLKDIGVCARSVATILDFNQHGWEDLYDHLMNKGIFTLTINKRIMSYGHDLDSLIMWHFDILQEVGAERKVSI